MFLPPEAAISDWTVEKLGGKLYEIRGFLTCSGASVSHAFNINYGFKLLQMSIFHSTADALTLTFCRPRNMPTGQALWVRRIVSTQNEAANFIEIFGDEYCFPAGTYEIDENSVIGTELTIILLVELLELP